eukprot:156214_1
MIQFRAVRRSNVFSQLHSGFFNKTRQFRFSSLATKTIKGHTFVPLSCSQKSFLAAGSAFMVLADTWRGDMLFTLAETTGGPALRRLRTRLQCTEDGRALLADRPRFTSQTVDMDALRVLPEGTFGRAYCEYMDKNGWNPDDRLAVKYIEDPDEAYIMQRYREVHDFWHILTGLPPNVLGELCQKWFEMFHTGIPVAALASVFGPIRISMKDKAFLANEAVPWAWKCSNECVDLLSFRYDEHFDVNLDDLRRKLRITPFPDVERVLESP